jgi:hypothetical protein
MPRGRTAHRVASRWAGFGIGDGDASRSIFWTSRSIAVDVRNRLNVGKIVSVAKKIQAGARRPLRRKNDFHVDLTL